MAITISYTKQDLKNFIEKEGLKVLTLQFKQKVTKQAYASRFKKDLLKEVEYKLEDLKSKRDFFNYLADKEEQAKILLEV